MIDIDHNTKTKQKIQLHGEVVRSADNIAKIGQEWDDLFARVQEAPAFLSRAWAETFISEKRIRGIPLLIVVWAGPELVALLPMSIRSFFGIRLAEPIGATEPSYLGLLADLNYAGAIQVVADVWIRERVAHAFYDKYLSSLDEVTNKLIAELGCRGFTYKLGFRRICPWIRLACSFDEYLKNNKSAHSRQTIRRKERKLCNNKDVKQECYSGTEVTPEILRRIAVIQQESWMKERGAAVLGQPFYQKLLAEMAKAGFGRLWLLTIDNEDAAFIYFFVAHRKLDLKWTAFKLKYRKSGSVGMILTSWTIQKACEEGILSYDFGFGDADYKRFWATDNHNVERVVAGRGIWGYLAVFCYSATWWLAKSKWLFSLYHRFKKWRSRLGQTGGHSVQKTHTIESG